MIAYCGGLCYDKFRTKIQYGNYWKLNLQHKFLSRANIWEKAEAGKMHGGMKMDRRELKRGTEKKERRTNAGSRGMQGHQTGKKISEVVKNAVARGGFFAAVLIWCEMAFHLCVFQKFGGNLIFPVLFAAAAGCLASILGTVFRGHINKIITIIFTVLAAIWYSTQTVYEHIFKAFLSVNSIRENGADAVGEFYMQALKGIASQLFPILLYFLPFVLLLFLLRNKKLEFWRSVFKAPAIQAGMALFFYLIAILLLRLPGKEAFSPYDLYYKDFVMDLSMEKLGVLTSTRKDIMQVFGKKKDDALDDVVFIGLEGTVTPVPTNAPSDVPTLTKEPSAPTDMPGEITPTPELTPSATPTPTPTPVDTSPNVLDIDFETLAENESKKTIKNLHSYMASSVPTNKNEYTGMFEGYNLIMLTAEGYSQWAVNKEITPTLYKMVHEGFYFENYYTPLWWTSTSDGEFVECTGLIPTGTNSFYKTADHYMPLGFGWQFSRLGYSARAYHNHSYTYYHRDKTHPNMGYDYKGAKGGGLEVKLTWPESDLEMMQVTVPEYINDEKFHTYYMTVSGHMEYNWGGNSMSAKNRDYVEDLPLCEEAKAYLAAQKELDLALEYLLNQLEEAGVADRTVIVLSGDHYPYGMEKSSINDLAGHEVEENFELYKSHLILYCPGMEPVTVTKPCSALDIVPTVLNLFGVEYDSRLFMGQDILSTASPLVMFSNKSYITDKVMYNSKTGEVTKLVSEELPEDYVKTVSAIVKNKFNISAAIITEDYYSYLKEYLPKQ